MATSSQKVLHLTITQFQIGKILPDPLPMKNYQVCLFLSKNRRKIFLLATFFLMNGTVAFGQKKVIFTVKGTVTDSRTTKPLADVVISTDYKRTGISTDSLGNFELFMPAGEYSLKMSRIGYSSERIFLVLKEDVELQIALKDESKQLDEVIISSNSTDRDVNSTSLGVSFLSIKGIKKLPTVLGEVDLLRSIQTLPGVSSVGEGSNGINVRGGAVDQNFILVDDTPIFNPTHLFGLFSVLPADAIRSLELYKGGIPASYGGRIASVLDVKLLEPSLTNFSLQGGVGPISNKLMAEIPLIKNKLSFLTASRLSFNDFWFKIFAPTNMKNTRANFYDLSNKLFYRVNTKNSISLSTYFNRDVYQVDSLFSLENIIAKQTQFIYGHSNASVKWNRYISSKVNFELVGAFSDYKTVTKSPDSLNRFSLENNIQYTNIKGLLNYTPNENHNITMGFAVTRYDINPGTLNRNIVSNVLPVTIPKEQGAELSVHFDDVMKVNSALDIQYGVRVVNYHYLGPTTLRNYRANEQPSESAFLNAENKTGSASSYWNIEPRVTIKYLINENQSIKFGYNRMGQFLQLITNSITPLPTARWKLSDNNVKPQIGDFATVGYFLDWGRGVWGLSAEVYYRHTKNQLDYTSGANLQLNSTIETQLLAGDGRAYGLELMVTKKKGSTTGWLSYTYSRSLQKSYLSSANSDASWYPTIYDKPNALNITLSTQTDRHNTFGFMFALNSGRPITSPTGTYLLNGQSFPLYVDRNNDRTPAYHRFDLSWTIDNPSMRERRWDGSWVFTVYNMYAHKNVYSIFFLNSASGVKAYSLSVFATPLLSLTYNFKFQ